MYVEVVEFHEVMAFHVARRREIGIRMVLGAEWEAECGRCSRRRCGWREIGIALGAPAATGLGRYAETLKYQVRGIDPQAAAVSAGLLAIVAVAASFVPTRRAAAVSPMQALP